ncbi:MAG TPA: hypothetical protein VN445_11465 [Rectinemataceae bacterium]|nr:hypothetical protein [Rectinemataceae bacterium]
MKKRLSLLALALLLCIGSAVAQTEDTEFALFKRTIAPVMRWGENGIMTVPKATTLGKANFFIGAMGQQAGTVEGIGLYLTSASLMAGTSDDVELGYTRRQLIWEDLYFTNLSMDTFHLKARFLNIADYFIPQAAIGVNAVSLVDNKFEDRNDILFNPYLAVTSTIPLFTPKMLLSVTAVAETIMNENQLGKYQFSGGADLNLFNFLYGFAEIQGFDPNSASSEVLNVGVKLRLGFLSAGVGMFNISLTPGEGDNLIDQYSSSILDLANANYMATVAIDIRLGKKAPAKK